MLSQAFYDALAFRESRGDPTVVNSYGFMGKYQMGQPALQDSGYMNGSGGWTGKNGINSRSDFLSNERVQDIAIREYHSRLWGYIPSDVRNRQGTTAGGIQLTKSGMMAAAHLVGHGGLTNFVRSNGGNDPTDEDGTPCSEYLRQFQNY